MGFGASYGGIEYLHGNHIIFEGIRVEGTQNFFTPHHCREQGTGEQGTFARDEFNTILDLATGGIRELFALQRQALGW